MFSLLGRLAQYLHFAQAQNNSIPPGITTKSQALAWLFVYPSSELSRLFDVSSTYPARRQLFR